MAEKSPAQHLIETIFPAGGIDTNADLFFNEQPGIGGLSVTTPTVIAYDTGGLDPSITADKINFEPTVQVRVVGAVDSSNNSHYSDAQQKMQSVVNLMIAPFSNTVSGTVYIGSYQMGDASFIGHDDAHRPIWAANFRLLRHF